MSEVQPPLHMVQMVLDGRDLQRSAKRQRLPHRSNDTGYLLHGHLNALFGDLLPQPFHSMSLRGDVEVLGYCRCDDATLRQQAETFAEPMVQESLKRLATKVMPSGWKPGQRLGFEVRVCPVVRLSSATGHHKAGKELDAFLAACERQGDGSHDGNTQISRPEIYRQWLERRFEGTAQLHRVELRQYRRVKLFRRSQGPRRKGQVLDYPEALMMGELEVIDPNSFSRLLSRGIGRHRAFGFGMLRLRPPQRR